jgi:hypothetical protein
VVIAALDQEASTPKKDCLVTIANAVLAAM